MENLSSGKFKTLNIFKNKYIGRRAFIIGNGPSLKKLDLTRLKNEITFGVNSIFYHFETMGFKPTFYVVEDTLVAEDRADEINNLTGMVKIFGTYLNYCLADGEDVIWANVIFDYTNYPGFPNFSRNAAESLWVGGTVSYLCMQLAYYMGFSEVYLVGFDHSYTIPKDAKIEGNVITSVSDDSNHFHPEYFGKGKRWHDPKLDRMELAYKRAKEIFEQSGRKIYNATAGGKLEIFPGVDYERLFNTATNDEKHSFNFRYVRPVQQTVQTKNYEPMPPVSRKIEEMRLLWDNLSKKSKLGYISHLQKGAKWDKEEFHLVGVRFVDRMMERFKKYGRVEPNNANILEIGCGVGRFIKPLASHFRSVCGVDISREMLKVAKNYCSDLWNVTFILNDGKSLKECESNSFDYCVSAGVFQHITHIEVLISYIREAIRVLNPGGLFLFQFEGNRTEAVGSGSTGARITARYLDDGLRDLPYKIREVSIDPFDPVRNVVIVIQKLTSEETSVKTDRSFQEFKMMERGWISGVYDDIRTKARMKERLSKPPKRLTFYYNADVSHTSGKEPPQVVVESTSSHKSFHQIPAPVKQENIQLIKDDSTESIIRISVIVCTYRNPTFLAKTLDSLTNQSLSKESYEIIVVDNHSQDNTKDVVEACPLAKYILEEKLGLSHARNTGTEKAQGDVIAFIDDDAEASPQWLQALLRIYDSIPDAWAVGGKVLPIWDSQKPDWLTQAYYRALSLVEWGENVRALCWPERIIGTNCSFRRRVFTDIGFFDTCLGRIGAALLGNEDTEIQQRIHALGHIVYYTPEAVVYHHVTASRMTEEYFNRRAQGTKISRAILELRSQGNNHQAEQIASEIRQSLGTPNISQKKQEAPASLISSLRCDSSETKRFPDTGCSQLDSSSDHKTVLPKIRENTNTLAPIPRDTGDISVLARQPSCATARKCPPSDNRVLDRYARNPSEMKWSEDKEDARIINEASRHTSDHTAQLTESERIDLLYDEIRANSSRLLMQYKDKYHGQRSVIMGNGPSLNNTDLSLLKNEYTFGLNKIYLLFDRIDWRPTFYVCVNPFVIQQSGHQILNDIPGLKFLDFVSFKYLPYNKDTVHLLSLNGKGFSTDPCEGVFQMHTVTYVAMQLAYYLGFDEVLLVGVDHFFNAVNSGQPDQMVVQNDYDTDHFDANYFGKGQEWNLPNLKGSEEGYRIAKATFENADRKIYDATIGGHLTVFGKVDFYDVFGNTKNSYLHGCAH